MVHRQARDLEVRVRVPVQTQIFVLKFNNLIKLYITGGGLSPTNWHLQQSALVVV